MQHLTYTNLNQRLGDFCKNRRKTDGLSVRELAEKTQMHHGTITKFEGGVTDISFSNAIKLFTALEIDFHDIIFIIKTSE